MKHLTRSDSIVCIILWFTLNTFVFIFSFSSDELDLVTATDFFWQLVKKQLGSLGHWWPSAALS